jgi:hypothetical protein
LAEGQILFEGMNEILQFGMARKALKKLHPSWQLFVDEVMDLLQLFYLGTQSREAAHFIHLIGYGKRQKANEILTDILELLDWESESIFLWENEDNNLPSPFEQIVTLQDTYPVFPKVIVTDFLPEFLSMAIGHREECSYFPQLESFLKDRKELQLFEGNQPSSDARGSLIISFLDSFGDCDFIRTRLTFQFLWSKPLDSAGELRKNFIPEDLQKLIEKDYFSKDELVFFSKDEPVHIMLAIELQKVTQMLELKGAEVLGIPIRLTFNAMDYFLAYFYHKRLKSIQLHRAAVDFFLPVFRQYPRMTQNFNPKASQVQLDFKGGWKFDEITL